MHQPEATADDLAVLAVLANGILPADERDAGAAAVHAGPRLTEKLSAGVNVPLYRCGLETAAALARAQFGLAVEALDVAQVHELLDVLRAQQPAFFRQLR